MINILVTGAGGGVGQGIIKSLKMIKDLDINIIGADMSSKAAFLYACDKAILLPACMDKTYKTALEKIFKDEAIDYYFPGTDIELKFCSLNKKEFYESFKVKTVISDINLITISDDKLKTANFLNENGLDFPATFKITDFSDQLSFPVIIKPRVGFRSIGVFKAHDHELINKFRKEDYIVQELVGTEEDEYTCTIVKSNNKLSVPIILRRVLRSGDTFQAQPVESPKIAEYILSIASKIDIDGGCNFQLRLDKNGNPKLFEINARFSGTTPFCSLLGFNPLEYYLKNQMSLNYNYSIDMDSLILRHWSELKIKNQNLSEIDKKKKLSSFAIKQISFFDD